MSPASTAVLPLVVVPVAGETTVVRDGLNREEVQHGKVFVTADQCEALVHLHSPATGYVQIGLANLRRHVINLVRLADGGLRLECGELGLCPLH